MDMPLGCLPRALDVAAGESGRQLEVASFEVAIGFQALAQPRGIGRLHRLRPPAQHPDRDFLAVLREGRTRHRRRQSGKNRAPSEA
jgi:hypothetical protein